MSSGMVDSTAPRTVSSPGSMMFPLTWNTTALHAPATSVRPSGVSVSSKSQPSAWASAASSAASTRSSRAMPCPMTNMPYCAETNLQPYRSFSMPLSA